ncbi:UDP-glucosyltransferase 29 [Linum perenne]
MEQPIIVYLCSSPINLASVTQLIKHHSRIQLVELNLPSLPDFPPHSHTTKGLPIDLLPTLFKALNMATSDFLTKLSPDLLIYDFFQPWAPKLALSLLKIPTVLFINRFAILILKLGFVSLVLWTAQLKQFQEGNPKVNNVSAPIATPASASSASAAAGSYKMGGGSQPTTAQFSVGNPPLFTPFSPPSLKPGPKKRRQHLIKEDDEYGEVNRGEEEMMRLEKEMKRWPIWVELGRWEKSSGSLSMKR